VRFISLPSEKDKMAKYRLLSSDELKALEKEFVEYLVVNGITADEWERLKKEENDKALQITDLFSDVVMEGALRKIKFINLYTSETVQAIQCLEDRMIMMAVKREDETLDLLTRTAFELRDIKEGRISIYKGQKKYDSERQKVIFDMTQKGYEVSDGQLFRQLALLVADNASE
jgi:hypothetical protein